MSTLNYVGEDSRDLRLAAEKLRTCIRTNPALLADYELFLVEVCNEAQIYLADAFADLGDAFIGGLVIAHETELPILPGASRKLPVDVRRR